VADSITPPHVNAIAWRGMPTPSTDARILGAADMPTAVAEARADIAHYRAITQALIDAMHHALAERDVLRDEVRRLREGRV
jgi:hypothetical protein